MEATLPRSRKFSSSVVISFGIHALALTAFLLTRPQIIEVGLPGATIVDVMGGAATPETPAEKPAKAVEQPPVPLPHDEVVSAVKKKPPKKLVANPPAPKPAPQKAPSTAATNPTPGPGTSANGAPAGPEAHIGLSGAPGVASDFPFGYYLLAVRNKVNQNWAQPGVDRRLKTTVFFRIARDGSVRDPRVELPSGVSLYDQAALRAVRLSSPFMPLPDGYTRDDLGVHFDFEVSR
jgi:TonB family protein